MFQTEINNTIRQLYQAAKSVAESKDANAGELKHILSKGICINITNEKGETAGSIAGSLEDTQAAQILLSHSANINSIALGAARGGHRDYAESFRGQGADINYIAYGAARGGHRDYAEFLRGQGADINYIAQGAALGGHRDYAESLRGQGADINNIVYGAAQGGIETMLNP